MTESELRWIVLRKFYEKREEGFFQWPEVDVSDMPGGDYLLRISDQLGAARLVDWKCITGDGGKTVGGVGKITGFGIDVIEGQQLPPIPMTPVKPQETIPANPVLISLRKFISRLESIAAGKADSQTDANFAKCVNSLSRFLSETSAAFELNRLNGIMSLDTTYGAAAPTSAAKASAILPVLRALEAEWQDEGMNSGDIVYEPQGLGKQGDAIFIGHGGSLLWRVLQDFLQNRLHLKWVEYNSQPVAGYGRKERLAQVLDQSKFAFLVMTAEDEQHDGSVRARENVVHEVGLFQGRLGFEKAIVLLEDGCAEFSNIHGLEQIHFPNGKIDSAFEKIRAVLEREKII